MAFDTMQQYYNRKDSSMTRQLNAAVYDTLNESKRMNRDFMEKLSSGCPTPTNRNSSSFKDRSISNSQKKVRFCDESPQDNNNLMAYTTFLQKCKLKKHMKIEKLKAEIHRNEMKELKWTPDLAKTRRYNNKISKSVVSKRREKSIMKHKEKINKIKQKGLVEMQNQREGCTFSPAINKKSRDLKRSFSTLVATYDSKKYIPCDNLFYL